MNETNNIELSLDWDDAFESASEDIPKAESIPDAMILSLTNLGRIDLEYIANAAGVDRDSAICALCGSIFQNPDTWGGDPYSGWETAEEYLSGNLRRKLKSAYKANKSSPERFNDNIAALRRLLPETVGMENIYVTLGSPWVPSEIIDTFIEEVLRVKLLGRVVYDNHSGSWDVPGQRRFVQFSDVSRQSIYGTVRMDSLEILEKTLNMKTVAVYDEVSTYTTKSGKKRVLNHEETILALEKQQKMVAKFREWVWKDEKRKELLEKIFDRKYGSVRKRIFDGSFLTFPGMNKDVTLYPYQRNAIARILFSPNTLLAHDVGSGKSYVMIAGGMELRRMGISKKNLYVVPNNIVAQWKVFFETLYPDAKILCVEPKSFTPAKRHATLESARDGDWDAVIMAYSCFDRIPLSETYVLNSLREEWDEICKREEEFKNRHGKGAELPTPLKRRKTRLAEQVKELVDTVKRPVNIPGFDSLGFTRLFVDEAHNYKNIPIETGADRVLGISAGGSKKCKGMLEKVRYIQKQNGGGGVVMATGTPITNSITEAFIMQKYLQGGELALFDLHSFDNWVGMFAEKVTEFEIDVDTNSYRLATRFSKFHNLPELTALFSSFADFHQTHESELIPDFDGYSDVLVPKSYALGEYLAEISERAEMVREGRVDRKTDNMLKITTDGRKAALDLRLVDDQAEFTLQSKVANCAATAYKVYVDSADTRGTQLIFCDSSTPKAGFNVYDEVKRLLVKHGVRAEEIAFIHDAETDAKREALFRKVRKGEIRILLGSTFKLGTGVNVQDRLIAIHHLDVPWRPADMTQREGRILRQGNGNEKVYVYRYITEGSFDAYSWQLLETKQRFISELLAGSLEDRNGADVDDTVLNYAEVKALAVGNPLVKKRVETANELSRILSLRHKDTENRIRLEKELIELPARIETQRNNVINCRADADWYKTRRVEYDKDFRRELRKRLTEIIEAHLASPDRERVAMVYQGFEIVLPADVQRDKPYLWLRHSGRYYIELGESVNGAIVRIDNFLDKLDEHLRELCEGLESLVQKRSSIKGELAKKMNYADRIEMLKRMLEKYDEELGVTAV